MYSFWKKGRVSRGGYETDGGIERILSRLHTVSMEPNLGLEPTNHEIMTWSETKSQTLNKWPIPMWPWWSCIWPHPIWLAINTWPIWYILPWNTFLTRLPGLETVLMSRLLLQWPLCLVSFARFSTSCSTLRVRDPRAQSLHSSLSSILTP